MALMERTVVECMALGLICAVSYYLTQLFSFAPYSKNYSRPLNQLLFSAVPLLAYLAYRLYFAAALYVLRVVGAVLPSRVRWIENALVYLFVIAGLGFPLYFARIQSILLSIYSTYVEQMYDSLYELSKPELLKAYEFGLRIAGLILGWFILLFFVELVIRCVTYLCLVAVRIALRTRTTTTTTTTTTSKGDDNTADQTSADTLVEEIPVQ